MKTIAIVGGGFSGTMTAVNLARFSEFPVRIILINTRRPLGRGTAYSTTRAEHLLNVAARNMSALPDHPLHFVNWLHSRNEYQHLPDEQIREMFAPRCVYGDYLRGLLAGCLTPIDVRCQSTVEAIEAEVVDIEIQGDQALIHLSSGTPIKADQVVLATGNQPPGTFPSSSTLRFDPRYRSDPWDDWLSRLPSPGGRIVLLGTGLTMVDIVLTLSSIGWTGEIVAISRNGMLPQSHFRGIAYDDYLPENAVQLGLKGLRLLVNEQCHRLRQMSQNPAIAVDKLRPHTQQLWQSLTVEEKREFLNRDASMWNVIRHRIAPAIHQKMTDALESGRLRVFTGTIEKLVPDEQHIQVIVRTSDGDTASQSGDLIINCTGPFSSISNTPTPLFSSLLSRGLIRPDELDMGIEVDENFATVNSEGETSSMLYAIGPLLKGMLWETTAVPELRSQAMRVAEALLQRPPERIEESSVIEYHI